MSYTTPIYFSLSCYFFYIHYKSISVTTIHAIKFLYGF